MAKITITISAHIDKFFKKSFNVELDFKNAGRTKTNTPTINMTDKTLSIISYFIIQKMMFII